jgi:hypothetical protein
VLVVGAWLAGVAPDERRVVLGASALSMLEVAIISALATLFASFSTPFLSAIFTIGVFIVGRETDVLARLPVRTFGHALHNGGYWLAKIWPNLQVFVPPRPVLTGESIEAQLGPYLAMAALTSLGWAIGLLTAAGMVFRRRDFL